MELHEDFHQEIAPFVWVEHDASVSVCLEAGGYLQEVFDTRAGDGFIGNGYDWESLAIIFLSEGQDKLRPGSRYVLRLFKRQRSAGGIYPPL